MITKLEPLYNHTSQETAYVVDDYPYGYRLRCKIRYWLEYRKDHGFRLCSQTTNPKVSTEVWNKPKCSTYSTLWVMGLDEERHVTWNGVGAYNVHDDLEPFIEVYGAGFNADQKYVADALLAALKRYRERKAAGQAKIEGQES